MWWKEFFFTAAYTGYFPVAPGTAASVFAAALYVCEYLLFGSNSWMVNAVLVVLIFFPAIKLCTSGEEFFGVKDPHPVVLDEVLGYKISVLFYPFDWKIVIIGLFLFRLFDILKPYPAGRLQKLNGGLGVVIDDCVAGIYANIGILICIGGAKLFDIPFY